MAADERATILSCLREADFLARELAQIDREIARYAVGCAEIRPLMTIPGTFVADPVDVPRGVVEYVAEQLHVAAASKATYKMREKSTAENLLTAGT